MTFTVYGIRLVGSSEARYIGQTHLSIEARLAGHFTWCRQMPRKTAYAQWLLDNEPEIEAFAIDFHISRADALANERVMIRACAKLGHRLFNVHHVPRAILKARRAECAERTPAEPADKAA